MTGSCLTCRWAQRIDPSEYEDVGDALDLECHRHAPQVVASDDGEGLAFVSCYFPCVSAFCWCGDWEEQEQQS